MDKNTSEKIIQQLVNRYKEHIDEYHQSDYNEAKVRQDFINPFFKALGWDIDNEKGDSEAYREVIYEDKVVVKGKIKAPDYGFRLSGSGNKRLFYVEAKKPAISLKANREAAYQLRRYGSSAQAAISILTNFEDLIIYDCSRVPNENDSATVARLKHIHFEEYSKEFDFIWNLFSHEAVTKGRFDKFIQASAHKKGTDSLDKRLVKSLDEWRQYLAKSIAFSNKKIDDDELNYAVQQIIDRLIFLRFCEDRAIEPYGQLHKATAKGDAYKHLVDLFRQADDKYNSGLFDFQKDTITPKLKIDNKVIRIIIEELYYPKCHYEFSVIPVEILGSAYEQFLGKVIKITPARSVEIDEKPEVRKAGGVYYTPQYIVDYIVQNTVGKLIEGKEPKEISKIKIVDPACGSGSFLLGAYEYLLNYHVNWYHKQGYQDKKGKNNPFTPSGTLTTAEKKKILLNNIFGVDLDANAVEVTKLSLLLKCMEGETEASIKQQLSMFHERVLPDMDNNIKNGNSLIDMDFYESEMDFGFEKKIKPFSWKHAFPKVFKQGGFDAVIGNPPYLKLTINSIERNVIDYYEKKFKSFLGGSSKNLFQLFIEKIVILKPKIISFIVPEALLTTSSNGIVRKILTWFYNINSITIFDHFVFQDATIGTTIFVAEKDSQEKTNVTKICSNNQKVFIKKITINKGNEPWETSNDNGSESVFKKILNQAQMMGELVEMNKGMVVQARNDVLLDYPTKKSYPFLLGNCMNRYTYIYKKYAEYDKLVIIGGTRDLNKHTLTPRLLIRRTGKYLCAAYSENAELIESTIYILRSTKINIKFLLGLINSKLLSFYLSKKLITNVQGFPQILMGQLNQLPIKKLVNSDEERHRHIITLVDTLINLYEEINIEKIPTQKESIKIRIAHCKDQINQLVYELYELTPEEIEIVERSMNE